MLNFIGYKAVFILVTFFSLVPVELQPYTWKDFSFGTKSSKGLT